MPDRTSARGGADPLRRRCLGCAHTEFVHADGDPRECLYSECACTGFAAGLATPGEGRGRRPAA